MSTQTAVWKPWTLSTAKQMRSSDFETDPYCDADPFNDAWETRQMLKLIRTLEDQGIFCCLVGVSALVFYGAGRVRHEWEVCVAPEQLEKAIDLLHSDKLQPLYPPITKAPMPQPHSLTHTYSRFYGEDERFKFALVPSDHVHITCNPSTIWRSHNGLPYPALPVLMQSFLDTHDMVSLCDLIDGANVSGEWGHRNLDLDRTNDVEWAQKMNERLFSTDKEDRSLYMLAFPTGVFSHRETWDWYVRGKEARLGWTRPKELFETRFRLRGSPDPWTEYSHDS